MVVSVSLEPTASVDYADLGGALSDAVTAEVPAAERAETEVTVTLSETATGTFSLGDGADADALTDAVEQNACQSTITCDIAPTGDARRRLDTTATYDIERTFLPDAGVEDIDAVFTQAAEQEDGVTDAETTSTTLSATAAVERQAASADSDLDSALTDPAAVASIQSAVEDVDGAGSATVTVEERAPPPPPPPPPPPRTEDDGQDDGDGDGDGDDGGDGGGGGGGGGVPIAAVAGGAGGGAVLLIVVGAIFYCRRNRARSPTQHQTRHSAGATKGATQEAKSRAAKPATAAESTRGSLFV